MSARIVVQKVLHLESVFLLCERQRMRGNVDNTGCRDTENHPPRVRDPVAGLQKLD